MCIRDRGKTIQVVNVEFIDEAGIVCLRSSFTTFAKKNDLYRFALPEQYGGWDLSELEILRVQEQFSRGPGLSLIHI